MIGKINIAVKENINFMGPSLSLVIVCFETGCYYVAMARMEHDM